MVICMTGALGTNNAVSLQKNTGALILAILQSNKNNVLCSVTDLLQPYFSPSTDKSCAQPDQMREGYWKHSSLFFLFILID